MQKQISYAVILLIMLMATQATSQTLAVYGGPGLQIGMGQTSAETILVDNIYYNRFYDIDVAYKTFKLFEDLTKSTKGVTEDVNYLKDPAIVRLNFLMSRCNVDGRETCYVVLYSTGKVRSIDGKIYPINKKIYRCLKAFFPAKNQNVLKRYSTYKN